MRMATSYKAEQKRLALEQQIGDKATSGKMPTDKADFRHITAELHYKPNRDPK